jgi:hypothetical protein
VGHFISAMPSELRARAEITAVELDPVTARILHHIHPDVTPHGGTGFERVDLPPNWFDLAISNVPFGDISVHDPHIPAALRAQVHDYFLAKALRLVRPGGLVVFLTSWGTLDKQARAVRTFLAEQATLLGAFRLPNGVFRHMSGSESATDLLILQKKLQPASEEPRWLVTTEAAYPQSTEHRSMTVGSRYTREIKDPELLADARVAVAPTASTGGDVLAPTEASLAEELLALARAEQADAGLQQTTIPPSPASLAWMAAEVERLEHGTVHHTNPAGATGAWRRAPHVRPTGAARARHNAP